MRKSNGWYWCVEHTVNGLIVESGNEATRLDILQWVIANVESLPPGEGRIVKKRVGK